MHKQLLSFFAVASCWCDPARAETTIGRSIEWLACKAEIVAIGKLTSRASVKGSEDQVYEDCVLTVSEVIKGPPIQELKFCSIRYTFEPYPGWMSSKGDLLVMLSRNRTSPDAKPGQSSRGPGGDTRLHNLLMPIYGTCDPAIFDLSKPPDWAYTTKMTVLTRPAELLKVTREWAQSSVSHSTLERIPESSPIHRPLYSGSSVLLEVPAGEKYRSKFIAMARAKDPYSREQAAKELYKFPGPETEKVLHELLKDDTEEAVTPSSDSVEKFEFPVRMEARRSLNLLGREIPDIQLERLPTDEEKRTFRCNYWRESFSVALGGGWRIESVQEGEMRELEGRRTVSIIVDCRKRDAHCKFTLIPKQWKQKHFPLGKNLGIDGKLSDGSRYFFQEGDLSAARLARVVRYFGLETP